MIDELDASLHPAAQNKLLNFIIKESRSIGIQTVFTTHSLSLLKYFIQKQRAQQPDSNDIELMYLTKGHGKVEIKRIQNSDGLKMNC
ncbi:AAA family ATPase [Lactiplantibacillus plantarum]|nr:AAA family ATPase [Lactiplantibacillus plantarum]